LNNNFAEDLDAVARIDVVPKILEVVCRTTGMGFAAVARVTEKRWVACAVRDEIEFGLRPGGELQIETTICDEIRESGRPVVIEHVSEDQHFCQHPTPRMYGFQSYISVPIFRPDGRFFGTLCAIDPEPAPLNRPETVGMFKLFADLIGFHLDSQERLRLSETALLDERQTAQLREQFIAVLGHDLRNQLNAIRVGADLLQMLPPGEQAGQVVTLIQRSAARMFGLIENVMDFARGRLGGGLSLNLSEDARLEAALEQVVAEARAGWPGRTIRSEISLGHPVRCNSERVAQMLSNLLANALTHGDPEGPVGVLARSGEGGFELAVTNAGEPIEPETIGRLFQPFARASEGPGQEGLGLGLYIASEIARAHGGTLDVASTPEETRFAFRIPAPQRGAAVEYEAGG
jgi:hypothetical protein